MTEKESQMVASAVARCKRYEIDVKLKRPGLSRPGAPLSENESVILLQAAHIEQLEAAAAALVKRYIANAGTMHEFVNCLTEPSSRGTQLLDLWRPLREALRSKLAVWECRRCANVFMQPDTYYCINCGRCPHGVRSPHQCKECEA